MYETKAHEASAQCVRQHGGEKNCNPRRYIVDGVKEVAYYQTFEGWKELVGVVIGGRL